MTSREIIILAGGKGSRLAAVNPGIPKCLAMVKGKPFLHHIIRYYLSQGIDKFVFSLGHLHQPIRDELENHFQGLDTTIVIEDQPLDTGGAILNALAQTSSPHVFVANGDTYFRADLGSIGSLHLEARANCTLGLTHLPDTVRYGAVTLEEDNRISRFGEKGNTGPGLVNGGIYLVRKDAMLQAGLPDVFSFEKDYLQPEVARGGIYGSKQDGYFIDIGIPEDLLAAQKDLPHDA